MKKFSAVLALMIAIGAWCASAYAQTINVQTFGAKCNGSADDTAALNLAAAYIRANGGLLRLPRGTCQTTTGLDFTHAPSVFFEVVGDGTVIKVTASSKVAYAIKTAPTGSKAAFRTPVRFRGISVDCNSKAFSGFIVDTDGSGNSDIVSFEKLYAANCDVGYDLNAMMESRFDDLASYTNAIGVRVMNHATAGGANANAFTDIAITNCAVGFMVRAKPSSLPVLNNTIAGLLVQSATTAAFLAVGTVAHINVFGAHFENSALANPTGTAAVEFGTFASSNSKNVTKADVAVYSAAELDFHGAGTIAAVFGSSQSALEGSGDATVANGVKFTNSSVGSSPTWMTGIDSVGLLGSSLDAQRINVTDSVALSLNDFYRSTIVSRPEPWTYLPDTNFANKITSTTPVAAAVLTSSGTDVRFGSFDQITFAASAGSYNSNSYAMVGGTNLASGQYLYHSVVVESDRDTAINLGVSGGQDISPSNAIDIALKANKPTLIRLVSFSPSGSIAWNVRMYPTGSDAPVIKFYHPYAAFAANRRIAARLANLNVAGNGVLFGSATYDPPNLAAAAGATQTITVTGAAMGDFAQCSFSLDLQGIVLSGYVSAADTVACRFQNGTAGALDLASGTLRARAIKQ